MKYLTSPSFSSQKKKEIYKIPPKLALVSLTAKGQFIHGKLTLHSQKTVCKVKSFCWSTKIRGKAKMPTVMLKKINEEIPGTGRKMFNKTIIHNWRINGNWILDKSESMMGPRKINKQKWWQEWQRQENGGCVIWKRERRMKWDIGSNEKKTRK